MKEILERLVKLVELKKNLSDLPVPAQPDRHLKHLSRLLQKGGKIFPRIGNQPMIQNAPISTTEPEFVNSPVVIEAKDKK